MAAREFIDHREVVCGTVTILTEYVRELATDMDAALGSALFFAIRREMLGVPRGTISDESDGVRWLDELADDELHRTRWTPSVTGGTVDAIPNRTVLGAVLISGIGRPSQGVAFPQRPITSQPWSLSRRLSYSASSGFDSIVCAVDGFTNSHR